jgi:hypothetical protein
MKSTIAIFIFLVGLVIVVGTVSCSVTNQARVDTCPAWSDNIKNPDNQEYVKEIAFDLDIKVEQVTQEDFNKRYLTNSLASK